MIRPMGAGTHRLSGFAPTLQRTEHSSPPLIGLRWCSLLVACSASQLFLPAVVLVVVMAAGLSLPSAAGAQSTTAEPSVTTSSPPMPTTGALDVVRFLKEETVVTAIRHEQPISEAPSNIYVITDEDIRHSGATDLPTLLRRIPGIEVMQMNGADFDVSARGDNQPAANKMLVLVDGRSIYDDVQGIVLWKAIPVTLPEIKRIEVLKGPASAVYGFNAFDGVINIITKSPEEVRGVTLQFGGGEIGTGTAAAIAAGKYGDLGFRLSAGRDQNNQWQDPQGLAFRSHKFNIQTEYSLPSQAKLKLVGGLVDIDRFASLVTQGVQQPLVATIGYADVAYERPNFFVRSWWRGFDNTSDVKLDPLLRNFIQIHFGDGTSVSKTSTDTYNMELQHALEFGTTQRLTYGVNYRHNTLSANYTFPRHNQEDRLGVYLQHEWKAAPTLTIVAGLRYDLHNEISPTVSPRLALLYTPAVGHTFRLAGSVAYRPPTLVETHLIDKVITTLPLPPPLDTTVGVARGSASLDPEQIVSYEVGYQGWFLRHRLRLRADLFFNHISNLVDLRSPSAIMSTFGNGRGADIYGGEAGVEFQATPWLSGFANYADQEIYQALSAGTRRGAPQFKVNAGLRGEWDNGLSADVTLHHLGNSRYGLVPSFAQLAPFGVIPPSKKVGSYTLLNLRVAYQFWDERVEVAISVFNALNDRHREYPLGEIIGSRVLGWLTMKF